MRLQTVVLIPSDDLRWMAVRAALHAMEQVEVIGEATGVAQALDAVARLRPDVVIAAGSVDGVPARAFLTEVRRICGPTTRLVILAADYAPDDVLPFAMIRLAAYYRWDDLTDDTLACCLATVWSNARIADELCLKNQTVRRYISDLCAKIGVASHYEAIVWAKDHGFGASC